MILIPVVYSLYIIICKSTLENTNLIFFDDSVKSYMGYLYFE